MVLIKQQSDHGQDSLNMDVGATRVYGLLHWMYGWFDMGGWNLMKDL